MFELVVGHGRHGVGLEVVERLPSVLQSFSHACSKLMRFFMNWSVMMASLSLGGMTIVLTCAVESFGCITFAFDQTFKSD